MSPSGSRSRILNITLRDFSLACQRGRATAVYRADALGVAAQIWRIGVGRVPLFICTNVAKIVWRSRHYRPVLQRRPRDASETGDPVRSRELPGDRSAGTGPSIFPRVKITRERRRLAVALDCVHIILPLHAVAFAQRAAYCQGWCGDGLGHGRVRGIGQSGSHGSSSLGRV